MAMILNEKYTTHQTNRAFYGSRLLRIYPIYFMAVFAEFAILGSVDNGIRFFIGRLSTIPTWAGSLYIFSNLTLFGLDVGHWLCIRSLSTGQCIDAGYYSINVAAWSLSVELMFYILAPFIVRKLWRIFAFTLLGGAYLILIGSMKSGAVTLGSMELLKFGLGYTTFPAAILYFGMGALSYHLLYKELKIPLAAITVLLLFLLSFTPAILYVPGWLLIVVFLGMPGLFSLTKNLTWDRFIGELSYPAYLFHLPVIHALDLFYVKVKASLPSLLTGHAYSGMGRFIFMAVLTLMAATAFLIFIEQPLEKWRQRLSIRWINNSKGLPQ